MSRFWTAIAECLRAFPKPTSRSRRRSRYTGTEHLEERVLLTVRIWDGGSIVNDKWTTAKNWVNDIAPVAGDELVFQNGIGILDRSTNNDFAAGTSFKKITVNDTGYKFTGNRITLTGDIAYQPPTASNVFANTKFELDIRFAGGTHQISFTGFNNLSELEFNGRLSDDGSPGSLLFTAHDNKYMVLFSEGTRPTNITRVSWSRETVSQMPQPDLV